MSDHVVAPTGKATIEHSRELKETLQNAFADYDSVVLDLGGVSAIDLTAIHLIYAAKRHALQAEKQFRLAGTLAPEVTEAFLVGGFTKRPVRDGAELAQALVDFGASENG